MKNASAFDSILVTKSDQKPHDVIEVRESKQVTISLGTVRRTHEYLWTECKKKKKKNHRLHNLRLYDHLRRYWCRHHQHYVILVCLKILVVDDVCLYVCLSVGRRLLFLLLLLSLNHDSSSSHLDMTFTVE